MSVIYNAKVKVGKETLLIGFTGRNLWEAKRKAQELEYQDFTKCGCCGSDDIYLAAFLTKEKKYPYLKIVCRSCKGQLTFGENSETHDNYVRKDSNGNPAWEKFEGTQNTSSKPESKPEPEQAEDDLPF